MALRSKKMHRRSAANLSHAPNATKPGRKEGNRMSDITVGPPTPEDESAWRDLFVGYRRFYEMPDDPSVVETVWQWICAPDHPTECLLARNGDGTPIGLAHFRDLPRPLSGSLAGFLDDLFVVENARGGGAADALVLAVADIGRSRGWVWLRWFTAEDNYRGRGFYDRVAHATPWKTYQVDTQG
jgi:GNAT superfamily N-acetyltransferase